MKQLSLLILGIFLWTSRFAAATTVGFSPVPSARTVVDSLGTTIGTNSLVWVGNFINEGFTFNSGLSISANVAAITIAGGWKQFGLDTATQSPNSGVVLPGVTIGATQPGKLGGSLADQSGGATKADFFNGKSLYVWLFNATSVGASTQMGIFRSTDAVQAWNFPSNGNGVGDSVTYGTTAGAAPTVVAIGGTGSATTVQLRLVAAVPEPSVLALGGMAALGMLASRKRGMKK